MELIKPVMQDDSFLTDVRAACGDERVLHIWWLGQSGFLLKWLDHCLLFDPYLSDSLTTKYAATDKPHKRMTERVVGPGRLDFINAVTSSHNHTDHLDAETLGPLLAVNPGIQLVIPEANRTFVAERLGCDPNLPVGLDDGDSAQAGPFHFYGIAAAHENLKTDALGRHTHLGYVARFGPWTVYHSGDTVKYSGMVERLTPFNVDVAILPINGSRPERKGGWQSQRKRGRRTGKGHQRRAGDPLPLRNVHVQHGAAGCVHRRSRKVGSACAGPAGRGALQSREVSNPVTIR